MRIYVDFDDCLSESARGFSDLAAELFGVHVPYEEMRFFNLQKAFSLTDEQYANRMFLQSAMTRCGFKPLGCEWWHFSLADEPYPDTYFEFPVSARVLRQ